MKNWNKLGLRILASFLCFVLIVSKPSFFSAAEVLVNAFSGSEGQLMEWNMNEDANKASDSNADEEDESNPGVDEQTQIEKATSSNPTPPCEECEGIGEHEVWCSIYVSEHFYEMLISFDTLRDMFNFINNYVDHALAMDEDQVDEVEERIEEIYNSYDEVPEDEEEAYVELIDMIAVLREYLNVCESCGMEGGLHDPSCEYYTELLPALFTGESEDSTVVLDKWITEKTDEDGNYTLTLESYATGKTVTTQTYLDKPADIVLVLDESGSMESACSKCDREFYNSEGKSEFNHEDRSTKVYADDIDPNRLYLLIHEMNEYNNGDGGGRIVMYCSEHGAWYTITNDENVYNYANDFPGHNSCNMHQYQPWEPYDEIEDANKNYLAYQTHKITNGKNVIKAQFYEIHMHKYDRRYRAVQNAAQEFLSTIYNQAQGDLSDSSDDVTHRVAIVGYREEDGFNLYSADKSAVKINTGTTTHYGPTGSGYANNPLSAWDVLINDLVRLQNAADDAQTKRDLLRGALRNIWQPSEYLALQNGLKNVKEAGTTSTHMGVLGAKKVLEYASDVEGDDKTGRNKVVVFFTDGSPGGGYINYRVWADAAIYLSKDLKNGFNVKDLNTGDTTGVTKSATVYTMGLYGGVDANIDHIEEYNPNATGIGNSGFIKNGNHVLHLISSNYPQAERTNVYGNVNSNVNSQEGYFLSASNGDALRNAFQQIAGSLGSETSASSLDSTTVVKDVVTRYFDVVPGSEITAYTMSYGDGKTYTKKPDESEIQWYKDENSITTLTVGSGVENDGTLNISMNVNEDETTTIHVSNFDFGDNYVGIDEYNDESTGEIKYTPHGQKLVLEIKIKPKHDFMGGNHVPTNTADSGIYVPDENGTIPNEPIDRYPVPDADVPINATAEIAADINVYLGSLFEKQIGPEGQEYYGLSLNDLGGVLTGGYNGIPLDFNASDYGLDPGMADYVDIQVGLYEATNGHIDGTFEEFEWSENPVISMDAILWDTPYKLQITITPKNPDGPYKAVTATDYGWIRVFYPEITFHDIKDFYYGESPSSDQIKEKEEGSDRSFITIDWINDSKEDQIIYDRDVEKMIMPADGQKPAVEMSYSIPVGMSSLPKIDVAVEALIEKIGFMGSKSTQGLNQFANFKWKKCNPTCGQSIAEHQGNATDIPEFYIHPQTCTLVIEKTGGVENEPYVFDVLKDGKSYTQASITDQSVVVDEGNETETKYAVCLKELPIGIYTIEEDTNWSWRFETTTYSEAQTLNSTTPTGKLICTNKERNEKWFNHYSGVKTNKRVSSAKLAIMTSQAFRKPEDMEYV